MDSVVLVIGRGGSNVEAVRTANSVPENWKLAMDRGDVEVDFVPDGEDWCVVLSGDFDTTLLDAPGSGVACYGHVPADSPALARWRST